MSTKNLFVLFAALLCIFTAALPAFAVPISFTTFDDYFENFNTLANSGTSSVLPNGWAINELGSGGDSTYAADNGSLATGNTYSYGSDGLDERGLGSLNNAEFGAMFGAQFQNNTGDTIAELIFSYRGEVWRLGTLGLTDRLDFQYSTNATSLTTGTWNDFDPLDFSASFLSDDSPTVGPHSGNSSTYNTLIGDTISGLSILNESIFWIRWRDFDLLDAADDGLSIDQFRITPVPGSPQLPEPSTIMLLANLGILGLVAQLYRWRRQSIAR